MPADLGPLEAMVEESLEEHRGNRWYYQAFQRDNLILAPLVIGYLDGGGRPTEIALGVNHYARGLVGAEDALRWLREPMPFAPI